MPFFAVSLALSKSHPMFGRQRRHVFDDVVGSLDSLGISVPLVADRSDQRPQAGIHEPRHPNVLELRLEKSAHFDRCSTECH